MGERPKEPVKSWDYHKGREMQQKVSFQLGI